MPTYTYRATGADTDEFRRLANRFLGPDVDRVGRLMTGVIDLSGLADAGAGAS